MKSRTRARSIALQALYEIDVAGHPPARCWKSGSQESELDSDLSEFARQIVVGVAPFFETLDHFIAEHAPEWPWIR